jgi:hypothetical protein
VTERVPVCAVRVARRCAPRGARGPTRVRRGRSGRPIRGSWKNPRTGCCSSNDRPATGTRRRSLHHRAARSIA